MPLARIRTADPVSVADLASELREAGYEFEFARPDERCAQEADVEIRAEHLPVQQAFDRAYEMNCGGAPIYVAPGLLEPAEAPPGQASANEADIRMEHTSRGTDYELPEPIPYSQSIDLDSQHGSPRFDYERNERRSRFAEGIAGMRGMVEGTISNFRERQAERATRRNAESAARAEEAAALRQKQLEELAVQREEARKRREEYERQQEQERIAQEHRERELAAQRERALALQRERDAEEARKAAEEQRQQEVVQRQREEEQRQREARETQLRMEEAKRAAEEEKRRAEEQRQQDILDAPRLAQEAKLRQEYERALAVERQHREQQFAEERGQELQLQARREEERRAEQRVEKERLEAQHVQQERRAEEERREAERREREARDLVARREREAPRAAEVIPIVAALSAPAENVRPASDSARPTLEPVVAAASSETYGTRTDDIHEVPAEDDSGISAVPLTHSAEREFGNSTLTASEGNDRSMVNSLFGDRPRQRAFQFAAVAAAVIALFAMGIWAAIAGRRPADPLNFGRNGQPNIQQAVPFGAATIAPREVHAANPGTKATTAKPPVTSRPTAKPPAQAAARKPSAKKRVVAKQKTRTTTSRTARRARNGVRQYSDMN